MNTLTQTLKRRQAVIKYSRRYGVSAASRRYNVSRPTIYSWQKRYDGSLYPFPNHPFKVQDDEQMAQTVESIKQYGVLMPAIVRPRENGGYEIVAGHRRKHGSELAGLETLPCIVRDMDDDSATIFMVDSNIQRENIPPSERAAAYKMKLEAIKRQGARTDLTSVQVAPKLSTEKIGEAEGISKDTVKRLIRLTELTPPLQAMVDEKKIAMTPAVELSYLKPQEQEMLLTAISSEQATPSLSQAQRMKKLSQEGKLTDDTMLGIMTEQKKPETYNITLSADKLSKYFPQSYTPQRMEEIILQAAASQHWDKSLLVGNIFCAHCGNRLTLTTSGRRVKRENGEIIYEPKIRYQCHYNVRHPGECDGQSGYRDRF